MKLFYKKIIVFVCLVMVSAMISTGLKAQVLYNEGFNTVAPLPAGWAQQNLSTPVGSTPTWIQGVATIFPANSGATNAYALCTYNSVAGANIISNWLFAPSTTIKNGDQLTFYTRTVNGPQFPDRLQVRLSTNGTSTNVGATNTSVGDFSTLLLDINPTYTTTAYPSTWTQYTITISGVPTPTPGRIAFRYFVEDGGPQGNNSDNIGIDDVVYTTFAGPCSGTPDPGNTLSTAAAVCPGVNFTLSFSNTLSGSGIVYKWQTSPDGINWTDVATGGDQSTYTTNQNVATYYRCKATCSGNNGFSSSLQVNMNPPSTCYCLAGSTDVDPTFEKISNVTFAGVSNASTSAVGYENFTNLTTPWPPSIAAGSTVPFTITGSNTYGGDRIRIWIDFNKNGDFSDAGDLVYTSPASAGPYVGTVVFPPNATVGTTRMRIRMFDGIFGNGVVGPCGNNTYGQVEDYNVNITPCIVGVINTQPANTTSYCSGNTSISVAATGTGLTYQWQERVSSSAPWTIVSNGGIYGGATTPTLTFTDLTSNFNGYQYQVAIGGPCTPLFLSNVVTLTVGPLVASVTPTSATNCNGTIQQISLTATAPPATATFSSGPINVPIPEGPLGGPYTAGISTIPVSIPAGAIITKVAVKMNITHAYVGDAVIVLKAPNGNIFNLDALLNRTNNAGANFVNTVISATGTTALSAGSAPWTGTFRPDAAGPTFTIGTFVLPGGPVGYIPNTATFNGLYSVPNGDWTLAFYDAGAPDVGNLTSWSLDITYGAPFAGVWSPATGLYTDPAATVPYVAGTLVNTVYANPTTSTDYSVSISTANCTSAPTIIPITVANPIGTVSAPANATVCVHSNTSFSVSASSGNPITYRWQVSTDGGSNWTNLSNGGVYGGTTTSTLTLTDVPLSYSDYLYRCVLNVAACNSTVNSASASLTVNDLPDLKLTASPYTNLYPGLVTNISVRSTPDAVSYQWYFNGVLMNGQTGNSVSADVDAMGDYSVEVVDVNGCSNRSASLTIADASSNILFIYPSPNTGRFQVRYYNVAGSTNNPRLLSIFDSKGARVYTRAYSISLPYTKMDVDMSQYSKGLYRVELSDASGKRIKTGSVLIQ